MYKNLRDICDLCKQNKREFWQVVMDEDASQKQAKPERIFESMAGMYKAMKNADSSYDGRKSSSGMVGADTKRLEKYFEDTPSVMGKFMEKVMVRALRMGECNACMKRIVAAPTAGSCGILPAVLLSVQEEQMLPADTMVKALFVAGGLGQVIAQNASIAGAQGGCQAEIGSASAMAAGACAYLMGGGEEEICHASAIALKGLLGLVCDPVAGLVEVPCVKRNVLGAVNAVTSAHMAMAGIKSVIPPDEVIEAMDEIGKNMPARYRETGEGGLAATPTGRMIEKNLH